MAGTLKRMIKLDQIRVGPLGESGMMSTTLTSILYIVPDSAVFVVEEMPQTILGVEETDYPDIIVPGGQRTAMLEFATRDMGNAAFIAAFGGTASGTPVWLADRAESVITRSVEGLSATYNDSKIRIDIPKANISGAAQLRFSKLESGMIAFSCKVLLPDSDGEVPWKRVIV